MPKSTEKQVKRPNGEGSFTQLDDGRVRYRDWVPDGRGGRVRKCFTGTSKNDAKNQWKNYKPPEGHVPIESVKTVEQWAGYWVEIYKKPEDEEEGIGWKSYVDYKMYIARHINPVIGHLALNTVREAHIAKLFACLKRKDGRPLSASSKQKVWYALDGIFKTALKNHLCFENPMEDFPFPEVDPPETPVFKRSHMDAIINFLPRHPFGPLVAVLLYSGVRKGEEIALLKTAVNRKNRQFHIDHTLRRTKNGEKPKKKTKNRLTREIPYDAELDPFIKTLFKSDSLYLICRPDGSHHTQRTFDTCYYSFFKDLNAHLEEEAAKMRAAGKKGAKADLVPLLSPHKCRHTCATFMHKQGADLRNIQAYLGHTNVKTTERYVGVDVDDLRRVTVKFGS